MQNATADKDERTWAMLCHLAAIAGVTAIPFAHILGPLVVWLIKKDQYPLVNDQGKESLNFQISLTIYAFGLGVLAILAVLSIIGIFLLLPIIIPVVSLIGIFNLVMVIIAGVKANEGIAYRYPITIRLIQ